MKYTPDKILGLKDRSRSIEREIARKLLRDQSTSQIDSADQYSSLGDKHPNMSIGGRKETFGADAHIGNEDQN